MLETPPLKGYCVQVVSMKGTMGKPVYLSQGISGLTISITNADLMLKVQPS